MKSVTPSLAVLAFILLVALQGCQTMAAGDADGDSVAKAPLINRLSLDGHTLLLPAGWEFLPGSGSGEVFSFKSPDAVVGSLETIALESNNDIDGIIEYYAGSVFQAERRADVTLLRDSPEERVVAVTGIRDDITLTTLIAPRGDKLVLLHLSSPPEAEMTLETATRILDTYSFEQSGPTVRSQPGKIGFLGTDSEWRWVADYSDGMVLYYAAEEGRVYACVVPLAPELLEAAIEGQARLPGTLRVPTPLGRAVESEVYFDGETEQFIRLHVVLRSEDGDYLLSLNQRQEPTAVAIESLLTSPAVQDLLDFYLVFPPSGEEG